MGRFKPLAVVLIVVLALAGLGAAATRYREKLVAFWHKFNNDAPAADKSTPQQWYTCAMHTQVLLPGPGQCPICGMPLSPINLTHLHDTKFNDQMPIKIDPVVMQNMGVRVAKVTEGTLHRPITAVGTFEEPEQNHLEINLRVSGWIEKLYANNEGMVVAKGDRLFDLYSPEVTAAADELIAARKNAEQLEKEKDPTLRDAAKTILSGARRKLELMGLSSEQIDAIAAADKAPQTIAFTAPVAGHVAEKMVREGAAVKSGDRVMVLADRSTMWLQLAVYERDLPLVKVGSKVTAKVDAAPDHPVEGTVDFIYPHLDMMTRTAKVRVVVPNHAHELHEGMYAQAKIDAAVAENALLVPREAVIDTGVRQVVILSRGDGNFAPQKVQIGAIGSTSDDAGEMVQIVSGVTKDDTVVTSGEFLLDSESRLQEAGQKLIRERLQAQTAPATQDQHADHVHGSAP